MGDITKVLLSITTVALVATLVVNGTNTAKVISSAGSAYGTAVSAAEKG
jgi:hypothetical protein